MKSLVSTLLLVFCFSFVTSTSLANPGFTSPPSSLASPTQTPAFIGDILSTIGTAISTAASFVWGGLTSAASFAWGGLKTTGSFAWGGVQTATNWAWGGIQSLFSGSESATQVAQASPLTQSAQDTSQLKIAMDTTAAQIRSQTDGFADQVTRSVGSVETAVTQPNQEVNSFSIGNAGDSNREFGSSGAAQ